MKYYSAKRNELMVNSVTWMHFKSIRLREATKDDILYDSTYITFWNRQNYRDINKSSSRRSWEWGKRINYTSEEIWGWWEYITYTSFKMYRTIHFKLVHFLLYFNHISLSLTSRKRTDFLWKNTCVVLFGSQAEKPFWKRIWAQSQHVREVESLMRESLSISVCLSFKKKTTNMN